MSQPVSFLAIRYKNRSFESLFSGSGINSFPYVLLKPEKTPVMAFREDQLDDVLRLIGLTRDNITSYSDTERANMRLIDLNAVYEYNINYNSSVNQNIQNVFEPVFVEILKRYPRIDFDISFTNNINSVIQDRNTYADDDTRIHLLLASIGSSGEYMMANHTPGMVPVQTMGNFIIPAYIAPEAVIKVDDIPVAFVKGKRIIMTLYIASCIGRDSSEESSNYVKSAMMFLTKSLDAVFGTLTSNPDLFVRLAKIEKEYKFMEFLTKLVSKRSEANLKRLRDVRSRIPEVMTELSELVGEEDYLNRIVDAINPDSERDRLLKEIAIIRKSPDVKDIVFEDDALMINMRHVMLPKQDDPNTIMHCGELSVMLPFDSKKEIIILRSTCSDYPSDMKQIFSKLQQPHPNVFAAGRLCYGNTAETFAHLRGLYDISSLFTMVNNFLHVYNPKSPTVDPSLFPTTSLDKAKEFYNSRYPEDQLGDAEVVSYSETTE